MNCRFCKNELTHEFADLGFSPPSNSFLNKVNLNEPEVFFPLRIMVCEKCFLVQIDEIAKHEDIFNEEYIYFSSFSKSWLAHAKAYTDLMIKRFHLNNSSQIVEIASNDGYLLQYFYEQGIQVLGIEPTANTAAVAAEKGISTIVDFFGLKLAKELVSKNITADVLLGNNVFAHVPDINDFVAGMKTLLSSEGVITLEFPHLMQLIDKNQFDTIYHEHFSYLSLFFVKQIFETHSLTLFDVDEISTHGGSLRVYVKHKDDLTKNISENVRSLLDKEIAFGINKIETYNIFQTKIEMLKNNFLTFLIDAKTKGKSVVAYGAAAKGNTLLNFAGIRKDLISYVVDASPYKQGKYLPGIHIPVFNEEIIKESQPDFIIILPWNLREEISEQLNYIRNWGGKFVVAIPEIEIF